MNDTTATVQYRSEIVFLYDAVDANPNGNPLIGSVTNLYPSAEQR